MNISKLIEKDYGADIIKDGTAFLERKKQIIPVSPQLDFVLNGGIPEGIFVTLTGHEKCGKTLTSLFFASRCQEEQYGSREIFYLNVEGRLKNRDLEGIQGLNPSKFHVVESKQGKILYAEDYLTIAEEIVNTQPSAVIILDSYSSLCPRNEGANAIDKASMAESSRLIGKFIRKVHNIIPVNKTIIIIITHLISNLSGYGSPYTEKSARIIGYQGDIRLWAKSYSAWEAGDAQIGQKVKWKCYWSPLGPPGREAVSYIRYGVGIDCIAEILALAIDFGLVTKAKGSWFTYGECKAHGENQLQQFFVDNPTEFTELKAQVEALL